MKDKWLFADSVDCEREFIVHLELPRFVGRIVETNEDGTPLDSEEPADVIGGYTLALADGVTVICEIQWFDHPPAEGAEALVSLLREIETAFLDHEHYLGMR